MHRMHYNFDYQMLISMNII